MPDVDTELLVADAGAWRVWLAKHHASSDGVWLVVGKKASDAPTSLRIADALDDLVTALDERPRARAMYDILTSQNRFAISFRVGQAKKPETRARRIEQFIAQLERGETIHPQRRTMADGEQT